jgi:hypothetical protein
VGEASSRGACGAVATRATRCVHGGALDACKRPLIVYTRGLATDLTRVSDAAAVDALQRLHAAVDGDHGDSAVALDDLDIAVEMSAPFVTMSRALLDVWGAEMGSVQPLQVGPTPCALFTTPRPRSHCITLLSPPQRSGLTRWRASRHRCRRNSFRLKWRGREQCVWRISCGSVARIARCT